jgi:hypothetical protein
MMADSKALLKVVIGSNRFGPHRFWWQGKSVRVLSVESIKTFGAERRYRVRTGEGYFEMGLLTDSGMWLLRRQPSWLSRLRARWQNMPRYPLPAWRRRPRRAAVKSMAMKSWSNAGRSRGAPGEHSPALTSAVEPTFVG